VKILIADDSPIIRERLATLLSGVGGIKSISHAEDTHTARQLFRKVQPDIAIVDIRIPKGGGLDLLNDFRKSESSPATIIILTNYAFDATRMKCLAGGADYFFDKSTEFMKVVPLLRELRARSTRNPAGAHRAAG
jgi:DNA-binding NarL/FixJ family response regulator